MTHCSSRQRGATLFVALIMLVVLTLFVVSALNTSKTNLQVVGNMQAKSEAMAAGQEALETVLSTTSLISTPANAVPVPCGAANTICTDVTGDGVADYVTTLTPQPTCVTVQPIKNANLNLTNSEDLGCSAGQQQQFGVSGAATGDSLCSNTVWEITTVTTAVNSGASVKLIQGVGVRVSSDDAGASC